jgi:hypothetical protein
MSDIELRKYAREVTQEEVEAKFEEWASKMLPNPVMYHVQLHPKLKTEKQKALHMWQVAFAAGFEAGKVAGREDAERLDRLDLYHREMDEWDRKTHPGKTMWVLFADDGVQGDTRRIIDAAIAKESKS